MIHLDSVKEQFDQIKDLQPLISQGQKHVLRGRLGDRDVVLKLFRKSDSIDEEGLQREMEAVVRLERAYIPKVLDWGKRSVSGEDQLFIIEECINGESYRETLKRRPVQTVEEVVRLAGVLLEACVDFESAGLVHRDIKPDNLMVGSDGKIWVIDFGIVRFLDAPALTSVNATFGKFTLGYGSLEQMKNIQPEIDARADLFAVGVVIYESLYGRNPFYEGASNEIEIIDRMQYQDLPILDIPEDHDGSFSEFICALTARFASRRPQTAAEALEWFREIEGRLGSDDRG